MSITTVRADPATRPVAERDSMADRHGAADRQLAEFWNGYVDSGHRRLHYLWRHPWRSVEMIRSVFALRVVDAEPSDTPGGRAMRDVLSSRGPLGLPARWFGSAVLDVPKDPDDYLLGRSAQTIRRKIRSAERLGVRCVPVIDADERRSLVRRAEEAERRHPDPRYRRVAPDNQDLLQHELWLKAVNCTGEVLLLAVAPVEGQFATLRYFRTLGAGPAYSDARYLATAALVGELAHRGVAYLLDTETPGGQTNGLRHFQRIMGFRYRRLRLRRSGSRTPALSAPTACAALDPWLGAASSLPI